MNEIKISGVIRDIAVADTEMITFKLDAENCYVPCVIEGQKSAVLYNYLMEGDHVIVTGMIVIYNDAVFVSVTGLEMAS